MVYILVDVAREYKHIEECQQCTNESFLFPEEQHAESKADLDYTRCQHHEVGEAWAELQLCGNLCDELLTRDCQMTETCIGHKDAQQQANE